MANDSGYSIHTHYIPIDAFTSTITNDIKNLIRKYGHIDCGLRHEELCEELNKYIYKKKTLELSFMNEKGKKKWNSEWSSKRIGFFNRLFEEEGFTNMCYPYKKIGNQSLYQLKSKHIKFCKKRDEWKADVERNNEYNECVKYNQWVIAEIKSLTNEFLGNVKVSYLPTVKKYFRTKTQPEGYEPPDKYRNSRLDCTQYNPPQRSNPKGPAEKAPTINLHSPVAPDLDQKSQGNGGRSIPGGDGETEKEKSNIKIHPKPEPSVSDSLASSLTHTNGDNTAKGQHTDLKAERTVSPNNAQDATGQPTETTDAKAQSTQQLPKPPSAASPEDSPVANVLDPRSPVIKGQGAVSDSSPSTTSATSHTTHSTQKVPSPSVSDLSLVQSQPPDVAAVPSQHQIPVTAKNSKEPTRPDPLGKSTDQDAPITFASDPGLAPSQAAASISSESETSSTTTISTPGSSLGKDSHLPTPSTHPIVTTSIDTTLPQTTTSVPRQPTITVAAMGTNPIQSIIEIKSKTVESGEPHALPKTIAGPQNPNIEPPKNQYDALSPNTITNFPDTPSSPTSANSNVILLPYPSSGPHFFSYRIPSPGLSSGVSLAGPPPALPASQVVVTRPDSNQIMMSPKDGSQQHKDITQVSSTSSPKGTQPSDKSIITPTNFPPLTSIIPTIVIIVATITLLFLLYKYTPFGLLLSRRRKRKKRDLRRTFEIPEKSTYESLNITMHEWEDPNLVRKAVENDVYIKLLKINRYKQEMQKRKKENKKTLIEVHMEVLEEYKNDEWELHKGDFLEICLRGFINEENDFYSNFPNSKLTIKNIKNEKTIEDIQKQEILWNNWIENHRNILEQWKKEEWFHMLKNKWRNEGQMYKDKNDKLQENISNEQETHSIVSQKNIWKQWISKQAALIDMFNKEDWFNSIVYARDKEKNNYHINEYSDISVTSKIGLKNDKSNHEHCKSKNIIQKLLVQIHMMVLEECIKDEIIRNKELRIDNFIEDIHNQNNYDQKRNIPQCDTDNFKVPEFEEIHTSRNK